MPERLKYEERRCRSFSFSIYFSPILPYCVKYDNSQNGPVNRFGAVRDCSVTSFAVEKGNVYNVKYDGGSLDLKAGTDAKLYVDADRVRIVRDKREVVVIPAASVTEISYGQDVHRRVGTAIGLAVVSLGIGALMALSKSKKHYIGLTWDDAGKKGGIAVQADKNDYRGLLAGLEGIPGKKAVDSDSLNVKN